MKVLLIFLLATVSTYSLSAELDRERGYKSNIVSVAPGWFSNVGVYLANGDRCNGYPTLILEKSNIAFTEIYSLLLAATVSDRAVHFGPKVGKDIHANGRCIIDEVAIDSWPSWTNQ